MALQVALCARFHRAVELIGRRWSGAVIQLLLLHGRLRYAQLRGAIPDISDRMLSERLRELEDAGIVARTVVPATPVRVEYELTEKGRALEPALTAIGTWAEAWVGEEAQAHTSPSPAPSSDAASISEPSAARIRRSRHPSAD